MKPTRITGPPRKAPVGQGGRKVLVWPCDNRKEYSVVAISEMTGYVKSATSNLLRGEKWKVFEFRAPMTRTQCGKVTRAIKLEKKREPYTVTHTQALKLVEAMIDDAKDNIVKFSGKDLANIDNGGNKSQWLDESRRFLCNAGGGLESLLACIKGFDTERALKELRNYALNGYKVDIRG